MDLKQDLLTGDIDISSGDLKLLAGTDAIIQHLRIRLRFFLGEWFLDTRLGIPYFQKILGQKTSKTIVKAIFSKAILGTPGIESIRSLVLDYEGQTRKLIISFLAILSGSSEQVRFEEEIAL